MSFQDYLPICPLDLSLSLDLLLFHIYFKFSSFCLCHSSLRSLSPCSLSASKNLSLPISRTAHTSSVEVGRLLFSPLFHSLVGVSQEKHLGPCEAAVSKLNSSDGKRALGYQSAFLDPGKVAHSWVWLEQTQGSDSLVSVLGFPSYVIMHESRHRAKLLHRKWGRRSLCPPPRAMVRMKWDHSELSTVAWPVNVSSRYYTIPDQRTKAQCFPQQSRIKYLAPP